MNRKRMSQRVIISPTRAQGISNDLVTKITTANLAGHGSIETASPGSNLIGVYWSEETTPNGSFNVGYEPAVDVTNGDLLSVSHGTSIREVYSSLMLNSETHWSDDHQSEIDDFLSSRVGGKMLDILNLNQEERRRVYMYLRLKEEGYQPYFWLFQDRPELLMLVENLNLHASVIELGIQASIPWRVPPLPHKRKALT